MNLSNKVLVVTGAGSGMGRELTLQLLKKGAKVAALDLNEQTLKETVELAGDKKGNISTHVANIADQDRVNALVDEVIAAHGAVDGVFNNAGIIQPFVKVHELEFSAIERVLNVNLYGVLYMTKAFLPKLLERPEALIANTSSMGGFLPVPGQAIYGASKAAVKLMTEALYAELMDTNVQVCVIFPGAIATNITENSGVGVPGGMDAETAAEQSQYRSTSAEDAAAIIIKGVENGDLRILVGSDAKMMDRLYRLMPKRAIGIIANQMKDLLS